MKMPSIFAGYIWVFKFYSSELYDTCINCAGHFGIKSKHFPFQWLNPDGSACQMQNYLSCFLSSCKTKAGYS